MMKNKALRIYLKKKKLACKNYVVASMQNKLKKIYPHKNYHSHKEIVMG